ncbi:cysteine-rich receptor-like protein kinase 6 [Cryptomeria japonica]|uniref:cysteine-rich receptor-like protein kinase 6 n=1 Tax=Cryptomeria japonica TaxID=3369 RepID=UPI0027DA2DBE|nr:cysteine-rich receptor-like protein kinase 6 [Cryptomeria japonica]
MALEYAMQGQLSFKVDIYIFGVLLLDIMSGRKNSDENIPYEKPAWRVYKREYASNFVDPTVAETCLEEKSLRYIQVGLLCVQADVILRLAMSNVIVMISSSSVTLPNPKKPAFINLSKSYGPKTGVKLSSGSGVRVEDYETGASGMMISSASGIASVNDASITQVNRR